MMTKSCLILFLPQITSVFDFKKALKHHTSPLQIELAVRQYIYSLNSPFTAKILVKLQEKMKVLANLRRIGQKPFL
jgi:hypothetical protein